MALLGVAFNAIVLGWLVMRPVVSLIIVTLGLGALMRGVAARCFRGVPGAMTLPVSTDPTQIEYGSAGADAIADRQGQHFRLCAAPERGQVWISRSGRRPRTHSCAQLRIARR